MFCLDHSPSRMDAAVVAMLHILWSFPLPVSVVHVAACFSDELSFRVCRSLVFV